MRSKLVILMLALLIGGCDKQRDLYDATSPLLSIEGDWIPSLGMADMSHKATVVLYGNGGMNKQYFLKPKSVEAKVTKGTYDILVFNGLFFSEDDTNLDQVYFKNTHNVHEFEAFVTEGTESKRLTKAEGEFIASNDMELLTSGLMTKEVEGKTGYFLKYENGKNGFPSYEDYIEDEVRIIPRPVSYNTQITVNLKNPNSAFAANGALRGFARSVRMSSGMPSHLDATHQLKLNNLKYTDPDNTEYGTIESPLFVTFGPPLDLPDRKYEFDLTIVLKDATVVHKIFDITDQILPVIAAIKNNQSAEVEVPVSLVIPIELRIDLPVVEEGKGGGGVDIGEWGEDEIIKIPITGSVK